MRLTTMVQFHTTQAAKGNDRRRSRAVLNETENLRPKVPPLLRGHDQHATHAAPIQHPGYQLEEE